MSDGDRARWLADLRAVLEAMVSETQRTLPHVRHSLTETSLASGLKAIDRLASEPAPVAEQPICPKCDKCDDPGSCGENEHSAECLQEQPSRLERAEALLRQWWKWRLHGTSAAPPPTADTEVFLSEPRPNAAVAFCVKCNGSGQIRTGMIVGGLKLSLDDHSKPHEAVHPCPECSGTGKQESPCPNQSSDVAPTVASDSERSSKAGTAPTAGSVSTAPLLLDLIAKLREARDPRQSVSVHEAVDALLASQPEAVILDAYGERAAWEQAAKYAKFRQEQAEASRAEIAEQRSAALSALGMHPDSDSVVLADEIARIRDEGREHFHALTRATQRREQAEQERAEIAASSMEEIKAIKHELQVTQALLRHAERNKTDLAAQVKTLLLSKPEDALLKRTLDAEQQLAKERGLVDRMRALLGLDRTCVTGEAVLGVGSAVPPSRRQAGQWCREVDALRATQSGGS